MAQYSLYRPWAASSLGNLFDEIRRDMDGVLTRYGASPGARWDGTGWRGVFPPVNLYEAGDAYLLTAELPGVSPDDIHVSLEGSTVTLEGERKVDAADSQEASVHRRERQSGSFRRAFELPAAIDPDAVEAVHKHGVLTLRLPKTPEHKPRQISVSAG